METTPTARTTMNGKPVIYIPAKGIINFKSGFAHKLLCDGPTFSTGTSCAYTCAFCYVPSMMARSLPKGIDHMGSVVRRDGAVDTMRRQLLTGKGKPRFADPADQRVIYSSPLVDVAANGDLIQETIEACKLILELTNWHIRLLSKSHLLPKIAQMLVDWAESDDTPDMPTDVRDRLIFGVSTGTMDDKLAKAFEEGTPLVSKRIESLHWLQDHGFRTFGMLCPSLPLPGGDYLAMAQEMKEAIRADRCEHVWAEVINVRGESMIRTCNALSRGGFLTEAAALMDVSSGPGASERWEMYARDTFEAHVEAGYPPGKLRYLQYVDAKNEGYWRPRESDGAILL